MNNDWKPIETAPRDGETIEVAYDENGTDACLAFWSDNPVCMLGRRCGSYPPGWATAVESDTDTNLPLLDVTHWRPIQPPQTQEG